MSRWLAKTLSKRNITDTEEKKDGRGESDGSEVGVFANCLSSLVSLWLIVRFYLIQDHGSDADFYDLHNHESPVKAPKPPTLTRKNSGIASGKLSSPSPSPRNSVKTNSLQLFSLISVVCLHIRLIIWVVSSSWTNHRTFDCKVSFSN